MKAASLSSHDGGGGGGGGGGGKQTRWFRDMCAYCHEIQTKGERKGYCRMIHGLYCCHKGIPDIKILIFCACDTKADKNRLLEG